MRFRRGAPSHPRRDEIALAGENILLLVIGCCVVAGIAWLALKDAEGTEKEARTYAEQTMKHLLIVHDAAYLSANLSSRSGYSEGQQRTIIYQLKKLGVPDGPYQLRGECTYGSEPGAHDAQGHYDVTATYPSVNAHFYLEVGRHSGRWRIDYFSSMWKDKNAPAGPDGIYDEAR